VLTIGTITPSAPASSAFMIEAGSFHWTRTMVGLPPALSACSITSIES